MAIINNNVQNVQFLRNQNPLTTREAAITALQSAKDNALDGSALLARYKAEGDLEVTTMVGYVFVSGDTKNVTIFDLKGSEAAVQALREEINARLGEGITSGNTATAQLAALSGDTFTPGTSSSADTSVEGAKAYAYDLLGTLDYTDTAVEGEYVSQVTQSDGVIAVTRVALPSSADTAVDLKLVTAVAEDKGQITVSRGEITSSNKTIILSANTDGGVDFKANVDGETIIIDQETGEMSVANSALIRYEGDDDTIQISAVQDGVRTVSSPLTISATTPSEANVKEQYNLVGASGNTIGATIKIYKDSALLSVALLHADTTATPQVLPTYNKATDTWTDIADPTDENQALCYAYEDVSGNTVVAAVPVGAFINEQEFASGITWDSTANKVRGVVDPTSELDSEDVAFLTVGANGFKIDGIKDEIGRQLDAVVEDLDATVTGATSGNHVTISIEELDGKLVQSGLTIEENDIASAADLAELSGKTVTALTSTNGSITASIDDAAGCKTYDIETDASKIQMSGFTSTDGVLSGITPASSVTEAFEEVDKIITENEEITSAALNDLDARIKTVSGDVETLTGSSLSGITVNDAPVTVANGVAALDIESATSAMTATNGEAIVVDTDENGNITLGLATLDCGFYV